MYFKDLGKVERINFLASDDFVSFTYQSIETLAVTKDGRKIIPGGTVYPKNDTTAIGLVAYDIDITGITGGKVPIPVIVDAWVLADRLPATITAEALTAMKAIKIKKLV